MPSSSLEGHELRKHTYECLYCDCYVVTSSIEEHTSEEHSDLGQELRKIRKESVEIGRRQCLEELFVNCTDCKVKLLKTSLDEHQEKVHPPPKPLHLPFEHVIRSPLIRDVTNLYQHERTADVFFIFEDQLHVAAHKCILASDSVVFFRMFYGELKETGDIRIVDASRDGFVIFLESFYKSHMEITEENVAEIMYLGNKYDAKKCTKACDNFLTLVLRTENVLTILELSLKYNSEPLRQQCVKEIEKTGRVIIQMDSFYRSNRDVLKQILSTDFQGRNELTLFEACVAWAKQSCQRENIDSIESSQLRLQLGDCFDFIRLYSMSPLQFVQFSSSFADILTKSELKEISKAIAAQYSDSSDTPNSIIPDVVKTTPCYSSTRIEGPLVEIENLFGNEQTTDVFFIFEADFEEPKRIPAHKCILTRSSTKFDEMFYGPEKDNTRDIHVRQGCAEYFSVFLQSFYEKPMSLSMANVAEVMYFGEKYDAEICLSDCEKYLLSNLTDNNILLAFELSHLHRRATLYKACVQEIKNNYEFLLETKNFLECTRETVKYIVMIDFEARNSFFIFEACMKWAKHVCETSNLNASSENLLKMLGDIFDVIRFSSMTVTEFIKCQIDYDGIFSTDQLKDIFKAIGDSK